MREQLYLPEHRGYRCKLLAPILTAHPCWHMHPRMDSFRRMVNRQDCPRGRTQLPTPAANKVQDAVQSNEYEETSWAMGRFGARVVRASGSHALAPFAGSWHAHCALPSHQRRPSAMWRPPRMPPQPPALTSSRLWSRLPRGAQTQPQTWAALPAQLPTQTRSRGAQSWLQTLVVLHRCRTPPVGRTLHEWTGHTRAVPHSLSSL